MSASAPWSVKGIDAKAREVAKDLARRSGMTLGEWLNQMILQGEDVGALINRERARNETRPEPRDAPESRGAYLAERQVARPARRIPEVNLHDEEDYDDHGYADEGRYEPRAPLRESHSREALYREASREAAYVEAAPRLKRAVPFSSAARPLQAREPISREPTPRDPRRGSIFEGRPRTDDHEDRQYAAASDDLSRVARALEGLGSRIETSETRSATAVRSVSHAVESLLTRLERSEAALEAATVQTREELQGKIEEQSQDVLSSVAELSRRTEEDHGLFAQRLEQAERLIDAQAERLEGLSGHVREERDRMARIETGLKNPQHSETLKAVEGALGKLANQLYEGDIRSRETVRDIREDMVGLSHRLAQIETRDPERAAQGLIDKVVTRLAERLEASEAQTATAVKTLENAFRNLEGRLSRAEERGDVSDPEAARSLTQLAAELSRRVEENRQELLGMLANTGRESIDSAVNRFEARLDQTERRSAAAIERMGQEVVRMADTFSQRVRAVEEANSSGLTRLGVEVTRVAETVENRAVRTESAHAQALERLGSEIARISERLSAKMADSERRTTQVLTAVGEQFEQQRGQVGHDLAERIRQSEERTAKLLEDARLRLDQKLAQVQKQSLLNETVARPAAALVADELPNPFAATARVQPAAPAPVVATSVATDIETTPFSQFSGAYPEAKAQSQTAPKSAGFDDEPVDLTGHLLNSVTDFKPDFDPFEDGDDEDFSAELMNSPLNPRSARAAALSASAAAPDEDDDVDPFAEIAASRKTAPRPEPQPATAYPARTAARPQVSSQMFDDDEDGGVSVSTRDALAAARAAVRASIEGEDKPLSGLRAGTSRAGAAQATAKPRTSGDNTLMKALKASSLAVVLVGGGAAGIVAINQVGKEDASSNNETTPMAAAVLTPEAIEDDTQNQINLKARYDLALQQIDARKPGAVEVLKEVANQGYAPAQFRLGRIYAGEGNLVKVDKVEERRWTHRAATAGYAAAMHYLGMHFYNGDGGTQDRSTAAMWFRKAAERGVTNSQFNLGLLYENGDGVAVDPSQAYKWFSLAGKSGDKQAVAATERMRPQLSETQLQRMNDAVNTFTPISDDAPPMAASAAAPQG